MKKLLFPLFILLFSLLILNSCKREEGSTIGLEANIKYHHNDYNGALQDINREIELHPANGLAFHIRGNINYVFKKYSAAIQDYNEALKLNPNSIIEYCDRGNAKMKLGDLIGALEDYNKSIDVYPYRSEAYFNRAVVKDSLKDYQGALQDYEIAAGRMQEDITTQFHMGLIHYYDKPADYLAAVHDFDMAIDMNPKNDSAYYYRGSAKFNLNDKSGACADWTKASRLGVRKADELLKQYCK